MNIYGIKNCDTCRKVLKWLEASGRDYHWRDLRADPPSETRLRRWVESAGLDRLVNRRSTTWRSLDPADRARAADPAEAPALLVRHPTLVKRPVFEIDGRVLVGFDETVKQAL